MAIYKERKTWRVDLYVNGKKFKQKCGFPTKREAKAWHDVESALLLQRGEGYQEPYAFKFNDLISRFEEIHLATISSSTKRRYLIDIEHRIKPFFKNIELSKINQIIIEDFKVRTLSEVSVKSTNNCIGILKTIFNKAIEWGMLF